MKIPPLRLHPLHASLALLAATPLTAGAQLFQNLQALTRTIPVGSGQTDIDGKRLDGPRWICSGDFDHDNKSDVAVCHLNGEITVLYGNGNGTFTSQLFPSGTSSLRSLIAKDFNGDGRDDLAGAAPYDGKVTVLLAAPGRTWQAPRLLASFNNARNLASGDFDGDGIQDIAAAGPDEWLGEVPTLPNQPRTGVVHFRGTGGGNFTRMGAVPETATTHDEAGRLSPVYSLQAFRRPGETKDTLGVTHENSPNFWLLRSNAAGLLAVDKTLNWWGGSTNATSRYNIDSIRIGTVFSPAATGQMDLIGVIQAG